MKKMILGIGIFKIISLITEIRFATADSQASINGLRAAHVVDEKFLSVSIDPTVFFTGISITQETVNLAKHLTPAYLRLAGPSTAFLEYVEEEPKIADQFTKDAKSIKFGASKWWTINEWIYRLNFTAVFALNDNDRVNNDWNPKGVLSMLALVAKMNISCDWQLGYDCSDKTEQQYKEDLTTLKHILDAFPGKKHNWKTVGSDISRCLTSHHPDELKKFLEEIHDIDAVMWEPVYENDGELMHKLLNTYEPRLSIWTSAPKSEHPISFGSALNWAVQIGEAAKNGFDVIFRQPRLQEMFTETPVYWVSVLHKKLMGRNVLDVKTSSLLSTDGYTYAHCSRYQNGYSIRGAMTVMIVNNGTDQHKTLLRVGGTQLKNVEVRSYILTSNEEETFLNNEKLTMDMLSQENLHLIPKLRRAKAVTHLTLTLPPRSIGFFVLPAARIPVCVNEEDETELILEEMHAIQNVDFPDDGSAEISCRIHHDKPNSLAELYRKMEQEMKEDRMFFKKLKPAQIKDDWKQNLLDKVMENKTKTNYLPAMKLDLKKVDLKNFLKKDDKPKLDIDLSSAEILKLLTERAKAKVEKKVGLAATDLDEIIEKAFRTKIRTKRDINMALLKLKTDGEKKSIKIKNKFSNFDKKQATIRRPNDTSDELLREEPEEEKIPSKIYAGFASVEEETRKTLPGLPIKKELFSFPKLMEPKLILPAFPILTAKSSTTEATYKKRTFIDYVKEDEDNDDNFDDMEDGLNGYHGFHETFGEDISIVKPKSKGKNRDRELWEFDDFDNSDLLESEFVINKADSGQVEKTIRKLEDFFNADKNARFKRSISKDDFFRKIQSLINDRKRSIGNENFKLHKDDFLKSILPPKTLLRNNLFQPNSILKEPKIADHQIRFLKSRLAHRKMMNKTHGKLKKLELRNKLRIQRSPKNTYDIRFDEIYVPKVNLTNKLVKSYESQLDKIKEWQLEDILNLPKPKEQVVWRDLVAYSDNEIPVTRNRIAEDMGKRLPRSNDDGFNSIENEIDGTFQDEKKAENKDYVSKVKNQTKIEVKEELIAATCLATDATESSATIAPENDNSSSGDDDISDNLKSKVKLRIALGGSEHEFLFLDKVFKSVNNFIAGLQKKVNWLLKAD